MPRRSNDSLDFNDTASPAAVSPAPNDAPDPVAGAARLPRTVGSTPLNRNLGERRGVVGEIDRTLVVIGEILDMLRQRIPHGEQTRIFVEAAATATRRAREITDRLLDEI